MPFNYRILQPDEYFKVDPIFRHFDAYLPDPHLSQIAIAEDEQGGVKGLLTLQLVPHCEPLYLLDSHVSPFPLRSLIDSYFQQTSLPGYLIVAENENSERLAQLNGMTKVEGTLYRKDF